MADRWYSDSQIFRDFGKVLLAAEVLDESNFEEFLSKPYRWTAAYENWANLDHPGEDDTNWDEFIESITAE
jgi:hypothetical protein